MATGDIGVFSHRLHSGEITQLRRGDYKQLQLLTIDLSAAGFPANGGARGVFEVECNGLILLPRVLDFDGKNELTSSVANTSRIYIRVNHPEAPWLPISLIAGSLDLSSITGTIFRFWIRIPQATAGASLYIGICKGLTLSSAGTNQGPSVAGYGVPGQTDVGSGGGGGTLSGGGAGGGAAAPSGGSFSGGGHSGLQG